MRTEKEFLEELEKVIRFYVTPDYYSYRHRLVTLLWQFREEQKKDHMKLKRLQKPMGEYFPDLGKI